MRVVTKGEDGTRLAYEETGEGEAVLCLHGFGSRYEVNWGMTGWMEGAALGGRRGIFSDARGHGLSGKPLGEDSYTMEMQTQDAVRILDAAGVERADVVGYSMGSMTAAYMGMTRGHRVRKLVLGGVGGDVFRLGRGGRGERVAQALESPREEVLDEEGVMYRDFASRANGEGSLGALADCFRAISRHEWRAEDFGAIEAPTLMVCGDRDRTAGDVEESASWVKGARVLVLSGKNHLNAPGDPRFLRGALEFFGGLI